MISLLILDHPSWWTTTGMVYKYLVNGAVIIAGVALFLRSKVFYFTSGWLFIIPFPLIALSLAEQPLQLFSAGPRHEQIFIYVWIAIALVELFLISIPILALLFKAVRGPAANSDTKGANGA